MNKKRQKCGDKTKERNENKDAENVEMEKNGGKESRRSRKVAEIGKKTKPDENEDGRNVER